MTSRITALSLGLCLLLSACGGSSHAGTYAMDVDKLAEAMKPMFAKMPGGAEKALEAIKKEAKGSLELKADNTWSMNMTMSIMGQKQEQSVTGTYKLEGDKITMTGKGKDDKKEETVTGTLKDGVLTMTKDGMAMSFKKG